jgi:hypothetical protein
MFHSNNFIIEEQFIEVNSSTIIITFSTKIRINFHTCDNFIASAILCEIFHANNTYFIL